MSRCPRCAPRPLPCEPRVSCFLENWGKTAVRSSDTQWVVVVFFLLLFRVSIVVLSKPSECGRFEGLWGAGEEAPLLGGLSVGCQGKVKWMHLPKASFPWWGKFYTSVCYQHSGSGWQLVARSWVPSSASLGLWFLLLVSQCTYNSQDPLVIGRSCVFF